ncbi:MAG TPA: glycosyltransferase [Candidatus Acidoferrum sp.]|nr:glycosyltransferase [Candidatus Acidoferrum sp.]
MLIDNYNYGRFIEEAIESVLAQDFPATEMEIVVVDDGSTDDTATRVKKYCDRVRYLFKENGGQASAFNLGFAEARGEIIALLDADDYWLPGKLQRVMEEFAKDPGLGMVYNKYAALDEATQSVKEENFRAVSGSFAKGDDLFWYEPHPTSCTSYRRKFLEEIRPVPEELKILADVWIGLLIPFVAPILALPECLTGYRIHGKNLYYAEGSELTPDSIRTRVKVTQLMVGKMTPWLDGRGYAGRPDVHAFVERLRLYGETEEFKLSSPGRFHYFRHQVSSNLCYGKRLTWRNRVINYVTALGTLMAGYQRRDRVLAWAEKSARWLWQWPGRSVGTRRAGN